MQLTPEDVHNVVSSTSRPSAGAATTRTRSTTSLDIVEAEITRLHRIIADLGGRPEQSGRSRSQSATVCADSTSR